MSCRRILLAVVAVALVASPAFAQPPGGQGRGQRGGMQGGGGMMLLGDKGIQSELKMTEEQINNVKALQAKQREEMQGMRDLSQEERREKMQEVTKKFTEELNKILNPDQQKRLKELTLQSTQKTMGWMALSRNPDVMKALELTDEQKESMKAIGDDMQAAMREMFQGGGGGGEEARTKMAEMRKSSNEKIEKLLTDAQKAKLKELMGEPYKGEFPQPGRGRPPVR